MLDRIKLNRLITIVASILLVAIMISTYMVTTLYARFTSKGNAEDAAKVAAFVVDVKDENNTFILDLSSITKPGDKFEYTFTLTNVKDVDVVSEVAIEYNISLNEMGSLPLKYSYVQDGSTKGELNKNTVADVNNSNMEISGTFDASVPTTVTYTLVVEWPEELNDAKYSSGSGLANLEVTITCEQID